MMGRIGLIELIMLPLTLGIPLIIIYYLVKFAVKNAMRELKKEDDPK